MTTVRVPAARVRELILAVLRSWGMPEGPAATTADVMVDTDLSGIDSHGVSMLMHYEELPAEGRIDLAAEPVVERDLPAVAVLDGRDGLGHPVTVRAVDLAITKARTCGHFVLAIDPELVNPGGRVQDNVDELVDLVRGSGEDVLVAGEPEERSRAERSRTGIPLSVALVEQPAGVCGRAGVHAVLDGS